MIFFSPNYVTASKSTAEHFRRERGSPSISHSAATSNIHPNENQKGQEMNIVEVKE